MFNTSKESNLRKTYSAVFDDLNVAGESMVERVFVSVDGAKLFVKDYFAKKEKASALRISKDENKIFTKSAHTVSVFCLGYYLRDIAKKHILNNVIDYRKTYFQNVNKKDWSAKYENMYESQLAMEFEFLWFMAALYHDISATMEKCDKKISWSGRDIKDISSTIDELEMLDFHKNLLNPYKLTSKEVNDIFLVDMHCGMHCGMHCVNRMTFLEKDVTEYFNYGLSGARGHQSINHGIVAGYLLFTEMVNILKRKFKKKTCQDFVVNENRLLFERTDIFAYKMAADAIIAHNIWFSTDDEKDDNFKYFQKYACMKHADVHRLMKRFIYDREQDNRLSIEENPLAFWLGLMDTIEPIKYFKNVCKEDLLDNLSVFIDGIKRIKIKLLSESSGLTILDLECWCREIQKIEIWLKVSVAFDKGMICIDVL